MGARTYVIVPHGSRRRRVGAAMKRIPIMAVAGAALAGLVACGGGTGAFEVPPAGPAVPLPETRPSVDNTFFLPESKDEVSLALQPRVKLSETVAADSDERTALAASIILKLPANRVALRHVDVRLAVKKRPGGQVAETKSVSFSRDTRGDEITVALGKLAEGTYDVDVRSLARVDLLDEDWTVVVDTKEATERLPLVIAPAGGKHEQSKLFEWHFDNDAAVPVEADRKSLEKTIKAIEALVSAHPEATARVDCWTSITGEVESNRVLAGKRCDWFKSEVWGKLPRTTKDPLAAVAHSVSELAADEQKRDVKVQSRNRVVRLRVRWSE